MIPDHFSDSADSIGEAPDRVTVEQFRKRMGDRAPICRQSGVVALGAPKIRVTAVVGHHG